MNEKILFVGLDVDDNSFHACLLAKETGEVFEFSCKPTLGALIEKLQKFLENGFRLRICYEAGYIGFSLCRDLRKHNFDCQIIASSLIPEIPGPRVKTDRLDSRKLASLYMNGLLTMVHIPDEEDETVRDLIRSRSFIRQQSKSLRRHALSLCRRMGLDYRGSIGLKGATHWSTRHVEWLESQIKKSEKKILVTNLKLLLFNIKQQDEQIKMYETEIDKIADHQKYKKSVDSLVAYRGISRLFAMALVTEIHDISRFKHPRAMVSYAGLDVREYSSGGKEKKFGITRMGSHNLRTTLVEICQSAAKPPRIRKGLVARRKNIDPAFISIADRCMNRLYKKSRSMMFRGKHTNKVKVACARELLGFVWESLHAAKTA